MTISTEKSLSDSAEDFFSAAEFLSEKLSEAETVAWLTILEQCHKRIARATVIFFQGNFHLSLREMRRASGDLFTIKQMDGDAFVLETERRPGSFTGKTVMASRALMQGIDGKYSLEKRSLEEETLYALAETNMNLFRRDFCEAVSSLEEAMKYCDALVGWLCYYNASPITVK